jgi:hypothetical protein
MMCSPKAKVNTAQPPIAAKVSAVKLTKLAAAERRLSKERRERNAARHHAEMADLMERETARIRAEYEAKDRAEADAPQRAASEKPMSRAQARALLHHVPDWLGDIPNAALVDLLDDESVAAHHARIHTELAARGLTPVRRDA